MLFITYKHWQKVEKFLMAIVIWNVNFDPIEKGSLKAIAVKSVRSIRFVRHALPHGSVCDLKPGVDENRRSLRTTRSRSTHPQKQKVRHDSFFRTRRRPKPDR